MLAYINYVLASLERILIMSISSLLIYIYIYIYRYRYRKKHIEKSLSHRISGSFGRKPLFHVIESLFKVAEAWVLSG